MFLEFCIVNFDRSRLLKQTVSVPEGKHRGWFPNLSEHLKYFSVRIYFVSISVLGRKKVKTCVCGPEILRSSSL